MERITVTWLGHACFEISLNGYTIVLDPYEPGSVPGLAPLCVKAHTTLCSHAHHDHCASQQVQTLSGAENPFHITEIPTFHDAEHGTLRGTNTIHLLESKSFRIAHFGDIGCSLTKEQMTLLRSLDIAMIPVGGYYTIGPQEAKSILDILNPKIVFPMHYRTASFGYDVLSPIEAFLQLVNNSVHYATNTLTVTKEINPHIAILSYLQQH